LHYTASGIITPVGGRPVRTCLLRPCQRITQLHVSITNRSPSGH